MYFISFGSYVHSICTVHTCIRMRNTELRSFLYEPSFNSNICMAVCAYVLALVNRVTFLPISLAFIIFDAKHHDVCASSSSSSYAFMAI